MTNRTDGWAVLPDKAGYTRWMVESLIKTRSELSRAKLPAARLGEFFELLKSVFRKMRVVSIWKRHLAAMNVA
jgi:hypothetical protein